MWWLVLILSNDFYSSLIPSKHFTNMPSVTTSATYLLTYCLYTNSSAEYLLPKLICGLWNTDWLWLFVTGRHFVKHIYGGEWPHHSMDTTGTYSAHAKCWLIDWVVVLRPTQHKIGHFEDVSPSQYLGLVWKKLNLTQKRTHSAIKKCTRTQNKHTKTKARFSCLLRHLAWKWSGPILKRTR